MERPFYHSLKQSGEGCKGVGHSPGRRSIHTTLGLPSIQRPEGPSSLGCTYPCPRLALLPISLVGGALNQKSAKNPLLLNPYASHHHTHPLPSQTPTRFMSFKGGSNHWYLGTQTGPGFMEMCVCVCVHKHVCLRKWSQYGPL